MDTTCEWCGECIKRNQETTFLYDEDADEKGVMHLDCYDEADSLSSFDITEMETEDF